MKSRKLVAVLACRNEGTRLFGKPLQNLCIDSNQSILDQIVCTLARIECIDKIVLAISDTPANSSFIEYAKNNNFPYVLGSEEDVLSRLIQGAQLENASDIFRVTSESPFVHWQVIEEAWLSHCSHDCDATFLDNIIDGCGFEIIKTSAMEKSWLHGLSKHRSEFSTLYIRENRLLFNICNLPCPDSLIRKDLRLTVDYPEDLIVCRSVYSFLKNTNLLDSYHLDQIVQYLDENKALIDLTLPFTDAGYSTMYL